MVSVIACVIWAAMSALLYDYLPPTKIGYVLVVSILYLLCGAVVFAGATWILSGVSTMSKEEIAKYNMDNIALIMGSALIAAAFVMLIGMVTLNHLGYSESSAVSISMFVSVAIILGAVPFSHRAAVKPK